MHQPENRGHAQHELDIVVIEGSRRELVDRREGQRRQNGAGPLRLTPQSIMHAHFTGNAHNKSHEQAEQSERPSERDGDLRRGLPNQRRQQRDGRREQSIDPLRPVHGRAVWSIEALLNVVEPALSAKHVANAYEAHGVVRFAEILAQRRSAVSRNQDSRRREPADDPRYPSVFVLGGRHGGPSGF